MNQFVLTIDFRLSGLIIYIGLNFIGGYTMVSLSDIEKAGKMASKKVPSQYREDASQEVATRCLELQATGVELTINNVSVIANQVVDYVYRHLVHDYQDKGIKTDCLSLDMVVTASDGSTATMADMLPSPYGMHNVENWVMLRMALKSIPPKLADIAARKLAGTRITDEQKQALRAWYDASFDGDKPAYRPTIKRGTQKARQARPAISNMEADSSYQVDRLAGIISALQAIDMKAV